MSWVRRHEGKELHPTFKDGANRFDAAEVDALCQRQDDERAETQASEALTAHLHEWFESHVESPARVSLDGIVERTSVAPHIVRATHGRWAAERKKAGLRVEPLLTRNELRVREQREVDAMNREYDERAAAQEREDERETEEQRQRFVTMQKRDEECRTALGALHADYEAKQAQRKAESVARIAALRARSDEPDLLDLLVKIDAATSIEELLRFWR